MAQKLTGQYHKLPEHLAFVVRFSLATCLRQGIVKTLEWSQVDLARRVCWIHPDQSKSRRAIHIHLNLEAMSVLEEVKDQHAECVFTYRDKPINQMTTKA